MHNDNWDCRSNRNYHYRCGVKDSYESYARFMSKDLESAFDAANKYKEKVAA